VTSSSCSCCRRRRRRRHRCSAAAAAAAAAYYLLAAVAATAVAAAYYYIPRFMVRRYCSTSCSTAAVAQIRAGNSPHSPGRQWDALFSRRVLSFHDCIFREFLMSFFVRDENNKTLSFTFQPGLTVRHATPFPHCIIVTLCQVRQVKDEIAKRQGINTDKEVRLCFGGPDLPDDALVADHVGNGNTMTMNIRVRGGLAD
jgi:hypothetical protein